MESNYFYIGQILSLFEPLAIVVVTSLAALVALAATKKIKPPERTSHRICLSLSA